MHQQHFKNFSRTTLPISSKLDIKHHAKKGFKFLQMKGHTIFKGEIIPKFQPLLNKFGTEHPWVKGIQVCSNGRSPSFSIGDTCQF